MVAFDGETAADTVSDAQGRERT